MASFIIEGGHPLRGTIRPQGAKNEALQVICATLLTSEAVTIHNIPNIRDVNNLIQLLRDIGVKVTAGPSGTYTFKADELNLDYLESDEFVQKCAALRGSVMLIGPLLARMGKAVITKPGGDKIGRRRLDTHFLGFQKLGAKFLRIEGRDVYKPRNKKTIDLLLTISLKYIHLLYLLFCLLYNIELNMEIYFYKKNLPLNKINFFYYILQ